MNSLSVFHTSVSGFTKSGGVLPFFRTHCNAGVWRRCWLLMLGWLVCQACFPAGAGEKPVLLYSRFFNAVGETRYLPEGSYSGVLRRLRETYNVRVHSEPLTPAALKGVQLLLIVNPSDRAVGTHPAPPHMGPPYLRHIEGFVRKGGGLIVMQNQEAHNLESRDFNRLLKRFGMETRDAYTDAKLIRISEANQLLGGLRWAYYTGNQVRLDVDHPAQPRPLVHNDLRQRPARGERDVDGVLMAGAEPGKGRVVVVTDSGWVANDVFDGKGIGGVVLEPHDNWEIFRRICGWSARLPAVSAAE